MAKKLKVQLDAETARYKRNLGQADRAMGNVEKGAKRAGQQIDQGMRQAAASTGTVTGEVIKLAGTYIGLQTLVHTIRMVTEAYDKAIRLRRQFAQERVGMLGGVAGMAAQFGVTEPQALQVAGQIAAAGGAGPGATRGVSDMLTALRSAGTIGPGQITGGAGQRLGVAPGLVPAAGTLQAFLGYTGVQPSQQMILSQIFAAGMGGRPFTQANTLTVLARIHAAYKESRAADWGAFAGGAAGGVLRQLGEGVSFETALSQYSALLSVRPDRPMAAGEMSRLVSEQLFTADRPEIVNWIGPERYWRLKKAAPDMLYREILGGVMEPEGRERAALYRRLKIAPELGGRISALRGVRGKQAAIRGVMAGARPGPLRADVGAWRAGDRARTQAQATAIAMERAQEPVDLNLLLRAAETEQERMQAESPLQQLIFELTSMRGTEIGDALESRLRRYYGDRGWDFPYKDIDFYRFQRGGPGFRVRGGLGYPWWQAVAEEPLGTTMGRHPRLREAVGGITGGTTVINAPGVQYLNQPGDVADNKLLKGGQIVE